VPSAASQQAASHLTHPWLPVVDDDCRALVLGTFPSPASRRFGFYYGHPQNVFWRVLADVLAVEPPATTPDARREFLLRHHIACWDVLHACTITGASDASISDPVPNLFAPVLAATRISVIFANGRAATNLFNDLCATEAGRSALYLPSTSPANRARQSSPAFREAWQQVARAALGQTVTSAQPALSEAAPSGRRQV